MKYSWGIYFSLLVRPFIFHFLFFSLSLLRLSEGGRACLLYDDAHAVRVVAVACLRIVAHAGRRHVRRVVTSREGAGRVRRDDGLLRRRIPAGPTHRLRATADGEGCRRHHYHRQRAGVLRVQPRRRLRCHVG